MQDLNWFQYGEFNNHMKEHKFVLKFENYLEKSKFSKKYLTKPWNPFII